MKRSCILVTVIVVLSGCVSNHSYPQRSAVTQKMPTRQLAIPSFLALLSRPDTRLKDMTSDETILHQDGNKLIAMTWDPPIGIDRWHCVIEAEVDRDLPSASVKKVYISNLQSLNTSNLPTPNKLQWNANQINERWRMLARPEDRLPFIIDLMSQHAFHTGMSVQECLTMFQPVGMELFAQTEANRPILGMVRLSTDGAFRSYLVMYFAKIGANSELESRLTYSELCAIRNEH